MDFGSVLLREVLNYYTLHKLFNFSDRKTKPVFGVLAAKGVDVAGEMQDLAKEISLIFSIDDGVLMETYEAVKKDFSRLGPGDRIIKKGTDQYPSSLRGVRGAPPYLFLRGNAELLQERTVSLIGTRRASQEGKETAKKLAGDLAQEGVVVVSGLSRGNDTSVHEGALESGRPTIAVIGTPLTKASPKENEKLQEEIAKRGLVISQFPPSAPTRKWNFPKRNAVMSAISLATAIVEAGETSGSLIQADHALKQGRKVFIHETLAKNSNLSWPEKYLTREGVHKFASAAEILRLLNENSASMDG